MLKLKLQYFGHQMRRIDSLGKTLKLGKIKGGRRRGRQRMRWLDGITDTMNMSLSRVQSWWWTGKPGVLQWCRTHLLVQEMQVWPLGQKNPLELEMQPHSSHLAWAIPGQRSLAGYIPWGHKELDTTEHVVFHPVNQSFPPRAVLPPVDPLQCAFWLAQLGEMEYCWHLVS